jgi:hypothetical protein
MKTHMIARLDEIDALADGRYYYRPVRHHCGITSKDPDFDPIRDEPSFKALIGE